MSQPWATSTRNQHLQGSRRQQRKDNARILKRHRGICHVCGGAGATEVDHVVPLAEGGRDHPSNKRPIHSVPCHAEKTKAEAARGRARQPSRQRPTEKHPGLA